MFRFSFNKEIQLEEQKRRYIFLYSPLSEMPLKIPINRIPFNKETQNRKGFRSNDMFSLMYTPQTPKKKTKTIIQ